MNTEMQNFLDRVIPKYRQLTIDSNLAYWAATTTGDPEADARYSSIKAEYMKLLANREDFAELKRLKESGAVTDPLLARQLLILYNQYEQQQMDDADIEKLVAMETEVEGIFNTFRATIDGEKKSDNEISDMMRLETDNAKRKAVWEGSKQIGAEVSGKVLDVIRFRNGLAKKLGYDNFYTMNLTLQELDETELFNLLGELERQTLAPFAEMKQELDAELSQRYGIDPSQMRPWHYSDPFFQEVPVTNDVDLDKYFEGQDVVALTKTYFDSVGLTDMQKIIDNSDLYEREGKYQHAYCTNIDREGDTRMLCNVRNNDYWMSTMLHEAGHAVYDYYNDPSLPYVLRDAAHTLTTEAIAMLFGRLTKNADFLIQIAGVPAAEAQGLQAAFAKQLTRTMLIFVRWNLVMTHFERDMYKNPDQDLNTLWWDYVERFQLVNRPEDRHQPDWAAKIHLAVVPVYYQNYMLGELTASQLQASIERDLGVASIVGDTRIGEWLTTKFFKPGARWSWNEKIEKATGEKLTPNYFVSQFVQS
ncbi:peptidyl-dipeptidase A [Tumebacillus sp. BK434]|uniref:M2 family metallopeptidase n=1 Tax=Tumebacillus sp. BK434 TaxID=2512169 RepID=UPI001051048C|nr:M2 family metallopeptidase [Tumebacillus sp. BK434]TCP58253.1 peptidyl-dipeptidase A [Tumebacillus sp. BK434]